MLTFICNSYSTCICHKNPCNLLMLILSSEDKPRSPNKCYKKKHLFARLTGVQNSLISRLRRRWKHLKSGFAFWETFQWRIQGAWPPLIFRPNWRKKWKNFLDTAPPFPVPVISRSGSGTAFGRLSHLADFVGSLSRILCSSLSP